MTLCTVLFLPVPFFNLSVHLLRFLLLIITPTEEKKISPWSGLQSSYDGITRAMCSFWRQVANSPLMWGKGAVILVSQSVMVDEIISRKLLSDALCKMFGHNQNWSAVHMEVKDKL